MVNVPHVLVSLVGEDRERSALAETAVRERRGLMIPLYSGTHQRIGALCALDTQPRVFSEDEAAILSDFAAVVEESIQEHEDAAMQEQLHREFERRMKSVTNSIPALIGYWNTDLYCEFANDAYRLIFGVTPDEMVGKHFREVIGEDLYRLNLPHARAALAGEAQRFQRRVTRMDGTLADTEGQYLPDIDEQGAVRGFFVLVTDVTELTAAKGELEVSNAQLLKQSTTDFLTGLANRLVFSDRCEAASRHYRESGKAYGLILLDLDDFKHINDEYGHDVGDEVLRAVGRILASELRDREDLAVRLGGEEFAVLCFGKFTPDTLHALAERIRTQIHRNTVSTSRGPVSFTSSFGIACSHEDDSGWKNIFARADVALYKAKTSGKDCIQFGSSNVLEVSGRFRSVRPAAG
ncbi:MAG: GGDEF domain-containing protein [Pseudomonadota bacterium]